MCSINVLGIRLVLTLGGRDVKTMPACNTGRRIIVPITYTFVPEVSLVGLVSFDWL